MGTDTPSAPTDAELLLAAEGDAAAFSQLYRRGARTTTRFERYEALAATEQNKALLSLRAQHPRATVDATEAGYQEAQARVHAQPMRADG